MNTTYGHYTSPRNATEYDYDATWRDVPSGLVWSATVSSEGHYRSHSSGVMRGAEARDEESAIQEAIERAIDQLEIA